VSRIKNIQEARLIEIFIVSGIGRLIIDSMVANSNCPPSSAPIGKIFMSARPKLISARNISKDMKPLLAKFAPSESIITGPIAPCKLLEVIKCFIPAIRLIM
jgi:hypothetical protein